MHNSFNRILCILFAVLLLVAVAAPAFAAETDERITIYNLPADPPGPYNNTAAYPYFFIKVSDDGQTAYFWYFTSWWYDEDLHTFFIPANGYGCRTYTLGDNEWKKSNVTTSANRQFEDLETHTHRYIWANFDIPSSNGLSTLVKGSNYPERIEYCDGSTCSADDRNFDNICDVCGKPLTMSLRSTLLDFAKSHAATYTDHPYFAVMQHATDQNRYDVFVSSSPMYANPPDYETAYGENLRWFQVSENEIGTFSYTGDNSVTKVTGELVYANHDIANFQELPLAVEIQGVTGEALKMEIPNLIQETRTIVLCGVGCLALLILLVLLLKAFYRFRS